MKNILIVSISLSVFFLAYMNAYADEYPICQSLENIEKQHGTFVQLIGEYKHVNTGKCWIAKVLLEDTAVVVRYQPLPEEVKQYNNEIVAVKGRVLSGPPKDDTLRQWLLAPHLVEIESLEKHNTTNK